MLLVLSWGRSSRISLSLTEPVIKVTNNFFFLTLLKLIREREKKREKKTDEEREGGGQGGREREIERERERQAKRQTHRERGEEAKGRERQTTSSKPN
jgi:hypothetical protein